ncbi:hypothetical protein [Parageobacillus thermoglucosidasius]|uniref:hypothetical protein n=1 Tax=Parageobacillus thermoglucosidasius TaxID=1426 RepID=UPI000555C608|nr:hypothetical protein [Parageobacillus thermoglucosidasius]
MEINSFNELIISDVNTVNSEIKEYLKENPESGVLYDLCRQTYMLVYNAEISKKGDKFQIFIPDTEIKKLSEKIVEFAKTLKNSNSIDQDLIHEIIDILKRYYLKTATNEEIRSRTHLEPPATQDNRPFGVFGTYYDFNRLPNWEEFKERLISFMKEL